MNPDDKLLIKKSIETIIKNIRYSVKDSEENAENIEIPKDVLLDYYNLITNTISDQTLTIYILHKISREINNSSSIIEKEILLTLLPEFYIPFINTDISLTDPYLSRILTSIQSNILSEISPLYIGEIFRKIILNIFNDDIEIGREPINKDLFEICQGFCLYNMRQTQYNYQLCGIICLNILLNELNYSFLNIKNYVLYIWEKIDFFLTLTNFTPKEYLLKYLYDFISKFKKPFEPYVNLTIYKILEYIDNKNSNIRKKALNVLSLLIRFYPNEIKPIKSSIIQLLTILQNDKDENIKNKSIHIYNEIQKQFAEENKSYINEQKKQKHKLYFYDLGNSNEFTNKILESNLNAENNNNRIHNKRLVIRKPLFSPSLNTRNNSVKNYEIKGLYRHNSSKTFENRRFFQKNKIWNIKENNRYYRENTTTSVNNKSNYNTHTENEIGFRDLLSIVKKKSDNKCKMDNNFYNLREEIKKNNNGLIQIRKIKSEKGIKDI
jgi:hypothetical protein